MHFYYEAILSIFLVVLAISLQVDSTFIAPTAGAVVIVFTAYNAAKARKAEKEQEKAKEIAFSTHSLVDGQRSALIDTNLELHKTIEGLQTQVQTLNGIVALLRETTVGATGAKGGTGLAPPVASDKPTESKPAPNTTDLASMLNEPESADSVPVEIIPITPDLSRVTHVISPVKPAPEDKL